MYLLTNHQPSKLEAATFAEFGMKESDMEEILRKNVDIVCDDEESMLIIGQQVRNAKNGRSDLTAIDNHGDIVLIEIKRDKKDITGRREAFEFQAIRYAASCATIKSTDALIQDLFAPYVEKHKCEFAQVAELTSTEIAKRELNNFIEANEICDFNAHQRVILVASEFDEQTLSAVAWLNSNQVDISCYELRPYKLGDHILLDAQKLLPLVEYDDYYVQVAPKEPIQKGRKTDISRRSLPNIDSMLEWGVVKAGDIIVAKGTEEEAVLQANGQVQTAAGIQSMQQWLKNIYGWSSVETYAFAIQKDSGKTLMEIRKAYLDQRDRNDEPV